MVQKLAAILTRKIGRDNAGSPRRPYSREFFAEQGEVAERAAKVVVPLVVELLKPRSVVDVGCGCGSWLAVFSAYGVEDILGVEAETMPGDVLRVPSSVVLRWDLTAPLVLDRTFDLVACLEVAEHLPPEAGEGLISSLAALGEFVLFSAAIPHQGGTNHINERWPDYWAGLFTRHGFVAIDCLRRKVWRDPAVAWWYSQNMLLFARENALPDWPNLETELAQMGTSQLSLVHPQCYESRQRALRPIFGSRTPW